MFSPSSTRAAAKRDTKNGGRRWARRSTSCGDHATWRGSRPTTLRARPWAPGRAGAAPPPNDLASSPLAAELRRLGAFRADVTGAGPTVYGLFLHGESAREAQREMSAKARTWLTAPAWYR